MSVTADHLKQLLALRHGDRKQGWDARARARAIDAMIEHYGFRAANHTEAFLDLVITTLLLATQKESDAE